MVLITTDEEDQVAFLLRLAATGNAAAHESLLKYGFNPAEPRAAGRWTTGGNTTTVSETPQRRRKEQRQRDAQSRYDDAVQGNEVAGRLARADAAHSGYANSKAARDAARKKYGIPNSMRGLSPKKRAAAAEILRASVRLAHLKARQEKLAARVAAIDAEAGRANATGHTRLTLERRRESAEAALKAVQAQVAAEQQNLSHAVGAWGHKAKKKSLVPDLLKAEGERIPKPGQRFWHGWIPVDAGMHDTLDLNIKRPQDKTGVTYHASHRIEGTGSRTPVVTHMHSSDESPPEIGVETTNPEGEYAHLYADERGGPIGASLDAKGARTAADHLRDLATIAESGQKIDPPKSTKHSRAADMLRALIEGGRIDLNDKLAPDGDSELPITHKDLLDLLAEHIPAPTPDQRKLRRVVKRPKMHDEEGSDAGDLYMQLDTSGAQPIIHVAAREREPTPWDPATYEDTAHLTPAQARELAEKLDQYANALPKEK